MTSLLTANYDSSTEQVNPYRSPNSGALPNPVRSAGAEYLVPGVGLYISDGTNWILSGGGGSNISNALALDAYPLMAVTTKFPKWNAAKKRTNNPARHLWYGDSNIAGEGSGTGSIGLDGAYSKGIVRFFSLLAGHQDLGLFGDQNIATGSETLPNFDPRWTFGTGWQQDSSTSTMGGRFLTGTAGAAGLLTFAIGAPCDTIELYVPATSSGNFAMIVNIDGVLVDTLNLTTGQPALNRKTYTTTLGIHTVTIGVGATGTGFVAGIQPYIKNSSAPVAYRGAWCGGLAANLNDVSHAWGSQFVATLTAPDFVTYYCTINDSKVPTSVAAYRASVEATISALAATADGCIFVGYPTASGTGTTSGLLEQYKQAIVSVARDVNWGVYDSRNIFGGSNAIASARSMRYDNDHFNLLGVSSLGTAYYNWLVSQGF